MHPELSHPEKAQKHSVLKLVPLGELTAKNEPPLLTPLPAPALPAVQAVSMPQEHTTASTHVAENIGTFPEVIEHHVATEAPMMLESLNQAAPKSELVAENVVSKMFKDLWSGKKESAEAAQPSREKQASPRVLTKEERAQLAVNALLKKEKAPTGTPSTRTILETARQNIQPTVQARSANAQAGLEGIPGGKVAGFKRLDHDMRYASYQARVSAHIANSHRIFMNHLPEIQRQRLRNAAIRGELSVGLSIIINKDGTLKECVIVRSSGDPFLDEIFIKFQRFIAPYPRIPDHLNISTFRVSGDFHFPI